MRGIKRDLEQRHRLTKSESMLSSETVKPIIVIPVFNGRDSLLKLIPQIESVAKYPILIVDDGSTDGLGDELLDGHAYIRHQFNQGKGAALKTGLNHARSSGYTHAVTLDGDGQHDPMLIEEFVSLAWAHPRAFLVGMRDLVNVSMPFHRKLSNNITSLMLSLRTGRNIRDSQVGYRCYPLKDKRLWESIEDGFQFESSVFFNVVKLRLELIWQPIPVIYGDEDSHMDLTRDTIRFIRTFFRSFKC